uniref:TRAP transporter small permease n=1 Tax=Zwartia sp. TaxID=2978004 RepID=UPI0027286D04|nr:TRAP transporter small permease [Zwartia sp.]MDO9023812.1 TRAP transporter small permease [Zwartia sp.]
MQVKDNVQAAEPTGNRLYETLRQKAQADLEAEAHGVPESHPIESLVVGGLATLALVMCSYNVIVRLTVPSLTLDFVEEVQVYMVIWAVFLSLGTVTLMDRHVKSDFFINMFPPKLKHSVEVFSDAIGLFFCVFMVYYGVAVAYQAWDFGDVSTTVLRVPLWIYFAALPAGGAVMGLAYAVRLTRKWMKREQQHA